MDFITQLPVTKKGYDAIAVFVDRLTKMVHFAPTYTDCSAIDVARLFNDTLFKTSRIAFRIYFGQRSPVHI
jgi:hypothetical protein